MFLMFLSMCTPAVHLYFQRICLIHYHNFDLLTFALNHSFGEGCNVRINRALSQGRF